MRAATQDDLRTSSDGALQNPIVRRVSFDGLDGLGRRDDAGDDAKLSIRLGEPLGPAVEFLSKHAESVRDNLCGDGEVDLAIDSKIEELFRLASELQCADEDVGVSDDALHERVRTLAGICKSK